MDAPRANWLTSILSSKWSPRSGDFQAMLGGSGSGFSIRGDFDVAAFGDIWTRFPEGQPDSFFGAFYQSVLKNLDWTNHTASRFLKELDQLSPADKAGRKLSIKFNVDGYNDDRTSNLYLWPRGRLHRTIFTR